MNHDAIKKINESMDGLKENRVPAVPIAKYLTGRLEDDENLAAQVIQDHKTLQKCFDFVYEQVRKHLDSKNGWIDDDEVYQMAVDYFQADDAELERKKAEQTAIKEAERKRQSEENRRLSEERKAKAESEKAQKALDKKQSTGQISLFGEDN